MYTMILEQGNPFVPQFSAIKAAATPHTTQTDGSEEPATAITERAW